MTACRFRWLPRFSLSNLLMLMVVVGLCLAWYDQRRKLGEQAEVIEKQSIEITRLNIGNILLSSDTDAEKSRALSAFLKVGDASSKIERLADDVPRHVHVSDQVVTTDYMIGDLEVTCENGRVSDFGYSVSTGLIIRWTYVSLAKADNGDRQLRSVP